MPVDVGEELPSESETVSVPLSTSLTRSVKVAVEPPPLPFPMACCPESPMRLHRLARRLPLRRPCHDHPCSLQRCIWSSTTSTCAKVSMTWRCWCGACCIRIRSPATCRSVRCRAHTRGPPSMSQLRIAGSAPSMRRSWPWWSLVKPSGEHMSSARWPCSQRDRDCGAQLGCRFWTKAWSIRKSSSLRPPRSCGRSQRGSLPRPDHVCAGFFGLRYLGRTGG